MPSRAAFYVDGFNFYHALNDLGQPHLKWLNHWRLAEILIPTKSETLVKVAYCTAYYPDFSKKVRHERVVRALQNAGVEIIEGHYVKEPAECKACGDQWRRPIEKETDINVALTLFDDAYQDVFDHAYLVTADSDQAAMVRLFRQRFPNKLLTTVAPPGRSHSKHILAYATGKRSLDEQLIERAVFPRIVMKEGAASILRPAEYDPPPGWVHPDDRPK